MRHIRDNKRRFKSIHKGGIAACSAFIPDTRSYGVDAECDKKDDAEDENDGRCRGAVDKKTEIDS